MLVKLCKQERMTLLNVVRRDEQAEILRKLGTPFDQSKSLTCMRGPLLRPIGCTPHLQVRSTFS